MRLLITLVRLKAATPPPPKKETNEPLLAAHLLRAFLAHQVQGDLEKIGVLRTSEHPGKGAPGRGSDAKSRQRNETTGRKPELVGREAYRLDSSISRHMGRKLEHVGWDNLQVGIISQIFSERCLRGFRSHQNGGRSSFLRTVLHSQSHVSQDARAPSGLRGGNKITQCPTGKSECPWKASI